VDDSHLIKFYDSGDKVYPCDDSKAQQFLDKIRKIEDYREDYLEKSIKSHCAKQQFADPSEQGDNPLVPYYQASLWNMDNNEGTKYCSNGGSQQKVLDRLN
jgi:hypothetical protein